jgi:hypothetical protein
MPVLLEHQNPVIVQQRHDCRSAWMTDDLQIHNGTIGKRDIFNGDIENPAAMNRAAMMNLVSHLESFAN